MIKSILAQIGEREQKSMYDQNILTSDLSLKGWPVVRQYLHTQFKRGAKAVESPTRKEE